MYILSISFFTVKPKRHKSTEIINLMYVFYKT